MQIVIQTLRKSKPKKLPEIFSFSFGRNFCNKLEKLEKLHNEESQATQIKLIDLHGFEDSQNRIYYEKKI